MAQAEPVQDFFVTVSAPDDGLLTLALQQQQELEAFTRSGGGSPTSKFLMRFGEDHSPPAFPTDDVIAHQMPIPQSAAGFSVTIYENVDLAWPIEEQVVAGDGRPDENAFFGRGSVNRVDTAATSPRRPARPGTG